MGLGCVDMAGFGQNDTQIIERFRVIGPEPDRCLQGCQRVRYIVLIQQGETEVIVCRCQFR